MAHRDTLGPNSKRVHKHRPFFFLRTPNDTSLRGAAGRSTVWHENHTSPSAQSKANNNPMTSSSARTGRSRNPATRGTGLPVLAHVVCVQVWSSNTVRHATDHAARESQSDILGANRSVPISCTSMKMLRSQRLSVNQCAHMTAAHRPGCMWTHLRSMDFTPRDKPHRDRSINGVVTYSCGRYHKLRCTLHWQTSRRSDIH